MVRLTACRRGCRSGCNRRYLPLSVSQIRVHPCSSVFICGLIRPRKPVGFSLFASLTASKPGGGRLAEELPRVAREVRLVAVTGGEGGGRERATAAGVAERGEQPLNP